MAIEQLAELLIESAAKGALGGVATTAVRRWLGPRGDDATAAALLPIATLYPALEGALSGGCVKVLVTLSSQWNLSAHEIFHDLYPDARGDLELARHEFEYRLFYLVLLGVVRRVGGEYSITELGLAFLREAQGKPKYRREIPERLKI